MNKKVGHSILYNDEESDTSSDGYLSTKYSNLSYTTKYLSSSLSESFLMIKDPSHKSLEYVASSSESDLLRINSYVSSKYVSLPYVGVTLPKKRRSDNFNNTSERIITTKLIYENKEFNEDNWITEDSNSDLFHTSNLLTSSLSESNLIRGRNTLHGSSNCLLLSSSENDLTGTNSNLPYYISSSNYLSLRRMEVPDLDYPHSSTSKEFISKQYGCNLPYMNENSCLELDFEQFPSASIYEEYDAENINIEPNAFVMYNNTSFRVHSTHSSDSFNFSTHSIRVNGNEKEYEDEYYDAKTEISTESRLSLALSSFEDAESTSNHLYYLPDDKANRDLKMLSSFDPNLYVLYENPNFGLNSVSSSEGLNFVGRTKLDFNVEDESEEEYCDAQSELEATSFRSHLTLSPLSSPNDKLIPNYLFHLPEDDIIRPELELILENFTFRSSGSENDSDVKYDAFYNYSSYRES